jgi:hypothetical protein
MKLDKKNQLLVDCLTAQHDFLEWLYDSGCLSEKGRKLYNDYWNEIEKF